MRKTPPFGVLRAFIVLYLLKVQPAVAAPLDLGPPGVGCAGDGMPSAKVQPSGLATGALVPLAGADLDPRGGDAVAGSGLALLTLRAGVCGRLALKHATLFYRLVYEPWDELERARDDAAKWGRFAFLELGVSPWRWLAIWIGVHKVSFSFGHDEPQGGMALPYRPQLVLSTAPDRRLGLTVDVSLGAVRATAGFYDAARDLGEMGGPAGAGFIATGRAVIEPFGPVGTSVSTLWDAPEWRRRPRFALGFSALYAYTSALQSWAIAGDAPFKWGPFGFVAEYIYSSATPMERAFSPPDAPLARQGLWAQASVMAWRPHIEFEGRYEWLDEPALWRERLHAFTAGLSVYEFDGAIRVQLAYTYKFHLTGAYDDSIALLAITLQR